MSCSACASAVERILKRMDGVTSAQVNLVLEEVVVDVYKRQEHMLWKDFVVLFLHQDLHLYTYGHS